MDIEQIKKKVIPILKKNKIKKAGIFGSYARGEQTEDSDIDILIEPTKNMGLEFVSVKLEIEDELNNKVDFVSYKTIPPRLKKQILKEEIRLI
ncbi:nucleotidyltransferase family protein [Candidatus Pacearchaeota archaeon]|nr:nucleotidyltransferase family protein [Candidatus Pacearchaeota archaeon]